MVCRAQAVGVDGLQHRTKPLPSLAALLEVLEIPVPSNVPLSNAGNEAYFTLLAFHKLVQADVSLPESLFSLFDLPPFFQNAQSTSHVPRSSSFGPSATLQMPNPPFVADDHRRPTLSGFEKSSSSRRASDYELHSHDRSSTVQSKSTGTPETQQRSGQTSRSGPFSHQPLMPRSQSVYWEHGAASRSIKGSALDQQFDTDRPDTQGGEATRSYSSFNKSSSSPAETSRNVSFGAQPNAPTSKPSRSSLDTHSGVSSGLSAQQRTRPSLSGNKGSSSKLSHLVASDSSVNHNATVKAKEHAVEGKLKPSSSIRNLAGKVANFWVG
jgi:hypothetical protein